MVGAKEVGRIGMWQGAWRIALQELKVGWRGYLLTLILIAYGAFFSGLLLHGHLSGEFIWRMNWGLDLAYFSMVPLLGFLMDPTMFRYRKEDTYSRKLAEWQTMPISVGQIVAGRMMLYIAVLFIDCVLYFGAQYAAIEELRDTLGPAGFALNLLTWFGFGVVAGSLLIFMELGVSGRFYYNFCIFFIFFMGIISLFITAFHGNLVLHAIEAAAERNVLTAAVSMVAAAAAVIGFGALLHRRIHKRSFWT